MSEEENKVNMKQDLYLQYLVNIVNNGVELGITLSVKGAIISGIMIPIYDYFEITSKQFEELGGIMADTFSKGTKTLSDEFKRDIENQEDKEKEDDDVKVAYIHLKDARYISHNGDFPQSGLLWRGKIEAVDGFTIGRISRKLID